MTDKEWLEEIKEWFNANEEIHEFQIEWLIKQAEKLEEIKSVFYAEDTNVVDSYRKIIEVFEGKVTPSKTKRS
jgi:hypothetical protein